MVLMYDRTSSQQSVNQARKELFAQKGRSIDGIPPTQAALIQHARRAAHQGGHCWGQTMVAAPELPFPFDWGWMRKDTGDGKFAGPLFQKQPRLVINFSDVGARKGVGETANVSKLPLQG